MKDENAPFLPVAEPDIGSLEEEYLLAAYRTGWISSLGEYITRFEVEFARLCHARYAVAVSNGTTALHLALVASGVQPGDEVIVPALTFVATASAVRHAGAVPVFVDSEPEIGTMDPVAVARAVTSRTRAVVPVHVYGHPVDMDPILEIARANRLKVIEDAAEAHGALFRCKPVGSIGDIGTFSFYGNKLLTTGEGGMLVTNDEALAERARFLKDHAMDPRRRYWHPEVGFNYRMTNLQAAIGCAQISRFEEIITKRRALLSRYRASVGRIRGVEVNPSRDWAEPVPWLVCALLPEGVSRGNRDSLLEDLREVGVDSRPYFHLLSQLPPYQGCRTVGVDNEDLPIAQSLSDRGFNLPSVPWLTNEPRDRIAPIIERFLASTRKNTLIG